MAPIEKSEHYSLIVIGGGSGGVAFSRRAGKYGIDTLLVEANRLGGTCVNAGCVPKKIMWSASRMANSIRQAGAYGFDVKPEQALTFDWPTFKAKRDAYVLRLNGIYARNLEREGVDYVFGWARFANEKIDGRHTIEVKLSEGGTKLYTADHICIATGGTPRIPEDVEGAEHGITSDGFFNLEQQPKSVAIVGAGYIATELAGVFHGLGTDTHILMREAALLRNFDPVIHHTITDLYVKKGIHIHKKFHFNNKIEKLSNGKVKLSFDSIDGPKTIEVDTLIWAIGRRPVSYNINVEVPGVELDANGKVVVDQYQNTSVPNIYSLGDLMSGGIELTPVAIATGRKLADRLFGPSKFKNEKQSFEEVPSVVFAHPELGTIGLTEGQARQKYGDDIKIYQAKFISMYWAPFEGDEKEPTIYKLIVTGKEEKVIGLHLVGEGSSEILQGFATAIKMGATKADFDNVVAIHPTSAEEIVTLV